LADVECKERLTSLNPNFPISPENHCWFKGEIALKVRERTFFKAPPSILPKDRVIETCFIIIKYIGGSRGFNGRIRLTIIAVTVTSYEGCSSHSFQRIIRLLPQPPFQVTVSQAKQ